MKPQLIESGNLVLGSSHSSVPMEFGFEDEHPAVSLPFAGNICEHRFDGVRISITTVELKARDDLFLVRGSRHHMTVQFEFQNFSLAIYPEVVVVGERGDTLVLKFANPTGDHVPQLRFVLNSFIAGDFVTLGSVMAYSGPTKPKEQKQFVEQPWTDRYRSVFVALLSLALILWAGSLVVKRYTTGIEMHPVLIERMGQQMQATSAGQVTYLNTDAAKGDILFSVNANSGDVLSFTMPCDCDVVLAPGVEEGVTVLPTDVILTILVNSVTFNVEALVSVEGLARAVKGDGVFLDMPDGRAIPVKVVAGKISGNSALAGRPFVPARLVLPEGALTEADVGSYGQLRLTKRFFWDRGA